MSGVTAMPSRSDQAHAAARAISSMRSSCSTGMEPSLREGIGRTGVRGRSARPRDRLHVRRRASGAAATLSSYSVSHTASSVGSTLPPLTASGGSMRSATVLVVASMRCRKPGRRAHPDVVAVDDEVAADVEVQAVEDGDRLHGREVEAHQAVGGPGPDGVRRCPTRSVGASTSIRLQHLAGVDVDLQQRVRQGAHDPHGAAGARADVRARHGEGHGIARRRARGVDADELVAVAAQHPDPLLHERHRALVGDLRRGDGVDDRGRLGVDAHDVGARAGPEVAAAGAEALAELVLVRCRRRGA